jgi:hypothetical protein
VSAAVSASRVPLASLTSVARTPASAALIASRSSATVCGCPVPPMSIVATAAPPASLIVNVPLPTEAVESANAADAALCARASVDTTSE